jgi:hypothetical protein
MSAEHQQHNYHHRHDDSGTVPKTVLSGQVGAAAGQRALDGAANARMVAETIERVHCRRAAAAASRSDFLRQCAGEIRDAAQRAAETGSHAGAHHQLRGHFIEALDVHLHNAKGGSQLVPRAKAGNVGYDASRFISENGQTRFAGAVQQKASANGTRKAIEQMEKVKPGSATRGTLRVPRDHVDAATRRATDRLTGKKRIRVQGMDFTSDQASKRLDQGLADVAKNGAKASSQVRALAKGGAIGAAVSVGIGCTTELGALRRGEVNGRDYGENRAVDAAEGATNAVVGTLAAGGCAALATAALGTAGGTSLAATVGAAGTTTLGAVGGMGTAGAAVATALGGVTATAALPFVAGGAAALGTGLLVGKGFKRVRSTVKTHQARRRELPGGDQPRQLPSGDEQKR